MEKVNTTHTDGPDGIAVISIGEGEIPGCARPALKLPILKGHLNGDLYGGGTVIGVEDLCDSPWSELNQPLGQLDCRNVGQSEQRRMGDLVQLMAQSLVQSPFSVTMEVDPERGNPVQIPIPVDVVEVEAAASLDDDGGFFFPVFHLGKRMPNIAAGIFLELPSFFVIHFHKSLIIVVLE